jgi:predicted enzyme related to lactoylglutathione lyase
MSSSGVLGQFLWHELVTTDPEAGAGFYSRVFGWNAQPFGGDPNYLMLTSGQSPVGGTRVVDKDPLAGKVGANWLTYVGVPDITAALAAVEAHGGRIIHPVTAIPSDGGRYAVIADPQGSTIGVYEPGGGMSGGANPTAGSVAWHELRADDVVAALQFYQAIFGWEVLRSIPMGGDVGTYYLFGIGNSQMGGAFKRPKDLAPNWPRWLVYLAVPSVTAAVEAGLAAGGKLLNGPHEVPGGNCMAQIADPHGVVFAVHGPMVAVKPEAKSKPKAVAAKTQPSAKPPAAKSAPKAKVAAKAKRKTKTKVKAKTRAKPKGKAKVKVKAKTKTKARAKPRAKGKGKAKPAARSRGRKAARRPK